MSEELAIAARYRQYAGNLRAAADFDDHAKTSAVLRRIAFEFDLMAQTLEDIARTNQAVRAGKEVRAREEIRRAAEPKNAPPIDE
jgi:DnaJ-domain-containing protein 1